MTAKIDLFIQQGATYKSIYTYERGGNPVDLTGCSIRMHAREELEEQSTFLDLNIGNGIEVEPSLGKITIHLSATETAGIRVLSGVYDLEIEYPDGFVERFMEGRVKISPEVTRQ